jgi:hypothetical protein
MSLIKCPECSNEISDKAKLCPKCGWKAPKSKLWVWIPGGFIGLFAVLFVMSSLEPEYMHKARNLRNLCEKQLGGKKFECDNIYNTTIADGKLLEVQKADQAKAASKK